MDRQTSIQRNKDGDSQPWMESVLKRYSGLNGWDRFHLRTRIKSCPYPFLATLLPDSGSLMDYGCGFGHWGWALLALKPGLQYHGWDPDSRKIEIAQASGTHSESGRPNFSNNPEPYFPENPPRFECITVLDVLYLIPPHNQYRLLKLLCDRISPMSGSSLILKVTPPKMGILYLKMLAQEFLMVYLLRKTKSSGTLRGSLPIEEYMRFGQAHGFTVDRIPIPENPASEIVRFRRRS